ncbi:Isopentenyldiphosphate isomerase [Suhomyces tanzawaensis NRRL Y-17324]|uniref:Isopentenyl-diphosphate Delta-isomerase n=1 Tax=Suhomyces tanzawaensis NRRL Y-17324 TaxID=984487 RepID=A0A1E4SFY7_9ASCO|nr:Isopentenyldiphosphate isomerase [Suhomyces tanzawaensis NRRL Y-17324]ODV78396.1 Isopentenyldiphosphate isomerase [Suhomyces tanzawaensis NRRL Y-17324]
MSDYAKLVASLSAADILQKWPVTPMKKISGIPTSSSSESSGDDDALSGHDSEQIKLMDELCIVLDNDDRPVGAGTKKTCHLLSNINEGLLHRAFSVFLFNEDGKLLLQQRADEKITFPAMWTNTCCSHPLCVPSELGVSGEPGSTDDINSLANAVQGAKVAAQRKLEHELGIPAGDAPLADFTYLTRIHYKSASADSKQWGEHEIDYILILKTKNDITIDANYNEVKDYKYVTAEELNTMFTDDSLVFTPWFKLICQTFLFKWWSNLDSLAQFKDDEIHRLL